MSLKASDALLDRLGRLHPKKIDLSLGRIERLLAALGHPEKSLPPVFHIAGTNGKGSVLSFLKAFLEADDCRVQAYTSPHLVRFAERIRLADGLISEEQLARVLDRCEVANAGDPITFFEITTAAAFLAFADEQAGPSPADAALVEVGLGGRFDATNVMERPRACLITPVSRDHEAFLGTGLASIAFEKAGIIKPGIPVFMGRQPAAAAEVIEQRAEDLGAPLFMQGRDWTTEALSRGFIYEDRYGRLELPRPALAGDHQVENAGQALAALRLSEHRLGEAQIRAGLDHVRWPARMQRITRGALFDLLHEGAALWLDGGHNPDAAEMLARHFAESRLCLVCGMMENREPVDFLRPLAPIAGRMIAVPIPGEASHDPQSLVEAARGLGLRAEAAGSVEEALKQAQGGETILIAGSLYLAGQVLRDSEIFPD